MDLEKALQKKHIAAAWEKISTLWSKDECRKGTSIPEKISREDNLTTILTFFHIRKGGSVYGLEEGEGFGISRMLE